MTRIWFVLVTLTLVEVAFATVRIPTSATVALLLALSIAKAAIIAWWFMHLRIARPAQFRYLLPMLLVCLAALLAGALR